MLDYTGYYPLNHNEPIFVKVIFFFWNVKCQLLIIGDGIVKSCFVLHSKTVVNHMRSYPWPDVICKYLWFPLISFKLFLNVSHGSGPPMQIHHYWVIAMNWGEHPLGILYLLSFIMLTFVTFRYLLDRKAGE